MDSFNDVTMFLVWPGKYKLLFLSIIINVNVTTYAINCKPLKKKKREGKEKNCAVPNQCF